MSFAFDTFPPACSFRVFSCVRGTPLGHVCVPRPLGEGEKKGSLSMSFVCHTMARCASAALRARTLNNLAPKRLSHALRALRTPLAAARSCGAFRECLCRDCRRSRCPVNSLAEPCWVAWGRFHRSDFAKTRASTPGNLGTHDTTTLFDLRVSSQGRSGGTSSKRPNMARRGGNRCNTCAT